MTVAAIIVPLPTAIAVAVPISAAAAIVAGAAPTIVTPTAAIAASALPVGPVGTLPAILLSPALRATALRTGVLGAAVAAARPAVLTAGLGPPILAAATPTCAVRPTVAVLSGVASGLTSIVV